MKLQDNLNTKELLPKTLAFDDHFALADKDILTLDEPHLKLMDHAEISWKEIEDFEFQKMDINASFEKLIKKI